MAVVADLCARNPWLASFPVSVSRSVILPVAWRGHHGQPLLSLVAKTIELAIVVETQSATLVAFYGETKDESIWSIAHSKESPHSELMTIRSSPNNAVKSTLGQIIVIA